MLIRTQRHRSITAQVRGCDRLYAGMVLRGAFRRELYAKDAFSMLANFGLPSAMESRFMHPAKR
jgi:hypothetical protein